MAMLSDTYNLSKGQRILVVSIDSQAYVYGTFLQEDGPAGHFDHCIRIKMTECFNATDLAWGRASTADKLAIRVSSIDRVLVDDEADDIRAVLNAQARAWKATFDALRLPDCG